MAFFVVSHSGQVLWTHLEDSPLEFWDCIFSDFFRMHSFQDCWLSHPPYRKKKKKRKENEGGGARNLIIWMRVLFNVCICFLRNSLLLSNNPASHTHSFTSRYMNHKCSSPFTSTQFMQTSKEFEEPVSNHIGKKPKDIPNKNKKFPVNG